MTTAEVLAAMRAGAKLHLQYGDDGFSFWLNCNMLPVRSDVGARVLEDPTVKSAGDVLFYNEKAQTYLVEGANG